MTLPIITENKFVKTLRSPDYNYNFSKVDGRFDTWGKTVDDDPDLCPYGPVIADVEVSSAAYEDVQKAKLYNSDTVIVTEGGCNGKCPFCYKSSLSYMIELEYEDGTKELVPPSFLVKLVDGNEMMAKNLKIGNEIV